MFIISLVESPFWITVLSISCIAAVILTGLYVMWKHGERNDRKEFDELDDLDERED